MPTVLTETNLIAQVAEPLTGIPIGPQPPRTAPAAPAPTPSLSIEPTAESQPSMKPAKLQAKRKAKSQEKVRVPESGPGTYQGAKESVRSDGPHTAL